MKPCFPQTDQVLLRVGWNRENYWSSNIPLITGNVCSSSSSSCSSSSSSSSSSSNEDYSCLNKQAINVCLLGFCNSYYWISQPPPSLKLIWRNTNLHIGHFQINLQSGAFSFSSPRFSPTFPREKKNAWSQVTFKFTIILFIGPPKFCISIVFIFSWDLNTMVMQNFGGTKMSIMVNLSVAYLPPFSLHRTEHRTVSRFILVPVPHWKMLKNACLSG